MSISRTGLALCLAWMVSAGSALGQQLAWYVDSDPTITAVRDGTRWSRAWANVQEGIDSADGDPSIKDVAVAEGTYFATTGAYPPGGTGRDLTILMKDGVLLHGGFLGYNSGSPGATNPTLPDGSFNKTVLSGATNPAKYHVVVADGSLPIFTQVVIDGFKIKGGLADGGAASDRDKGGGLLNRDAPILVENVTFRKNTAKKGGGAYHFGTSETFQCRKSQFRLNDANNGAGFYVGSQSKKVELCNVRFRSNGTLSLLEPFTTTRGGGMFIEIECNIEVANCVFDENEAYIEGGGIYVDPDDFVNAIDEHDWRHCTIAFNAVAGGGLTGAGMHYDIGSTAATATLDNCILWGNLGGRDLFVDVSPSVTYSYCDVGTVTGGTAGPGVISVDPLFVNAPNGNLRLKGPLHIFPWSPCLDAGLDALIGPDFLDIDDDGNPPPIEDLPLDLDLKTRAIDIPSVPGPGTVDMGAYEAPAALPPIGT